MTFTEMILQNMSYLDASNNLSPTFFSRSRQSSESEAEQLITEKKPTFLLTVSEYDVIQEILQYAK